MLVRANMIKIRQWAVNSFNSKLFPHKSGLFSVVKLLLHRHLFKIKTNMASGLTCTTALSFFETFYQGCTCRYDIYEI